MGRRAGETCTELMLVRFLEPRGSSWGVFLEEAEEEAGPGRSCGLCVAERVVGGLVNTGEGRGARPGVFDELGSWGACLGVCVIIGVKSALPKLADSGNSKVSMCSVSIGSWLPDRADGLLLLGELSFMSDAGVAGEVPE